MSGNIVCPVEPAHIKRGEKNGDPPASEPGVLFTFEIRGNMAPGSGIGYRQFIPAAEFKRKGPRGSEEMVFKIQHHIGHQLFTALAQSGFFRR